MSWKVTWCDKTTKDDPIQSSDAEAQDEVLGLLQKALANDASDISVSKCGTDAKLGGVPFPTIAARLKEKTVVPFLGAGVPLCERLEGQKWRKGSPFLPNAAELARYLAFLCDFPIRNIRDADNLARVASYYTINNPGEYLTTELRAIFEAGAYNSVHEFFAEPKLHPMLLVTTNYDTLMEQALEATGVPFDTVIHCTDIDHRGSVLVKEHASNTGRYATPAQYDVKLAERTVLYKMHGSISRSNASVQPTTSNFVITEEDYVAFLSRISSSPPVVPTVFLRHFRASSFLFLGYSLEDWNVRVILDNLNEVMSDGAVSSKQDTATNSSSISAKGTENNPALLASSPVAEALKKQKGTVATPTARRHWAIQLHPTPYDIAVWQGRKVDIKDMKLDDFVKQLRNRAFGLFP